MVSTQEPNTKNQEPLLAELALHSFEEFLPTLAQRSVRLPADVVRQQLHGIQSGTSGKVAQRGEPAPWTRIEQLSPRPMNLRAPDDCASDEASDHRRRHRYLRFSPHIALRAFRAWAMVTPSAYSRSPPTGIPRAIRVTETG